LLAVIDYRFEIDFHEFSFLEQIFAVAVTSSTLE
jgi:hypothetical protein